MIRVFIIADSLLGARRLAELLDEDDRLEIADARAISFLRDHGTGEMADVIVTSRVPLRNIPDMGLPVVMLTDNAAGELPTSGIVHAVLPLDSTPAEVTAAIIAAANGLFVLTGQQAARRLFQAGHKNQSDGPMLETLTPRELEVLRLLATGLGNKEIAGQLGISENTAKFHVAQILAKLGASSRAEAVAIGIRLGFVPI